MKILGSASVKRDILLEFKTDAFRKLLDRLLITSRFNTPHIRAALNAYLLAVGVYPDDDSVLAWLQNNSGEYISISIIEVKEKLIDFSLEAGDRKDGTRQSKGTGP